MKKIDDDSLLDATDFPMEDDDEYEEFEDSEELIPSDNIGEYDWEFDDFS